MNVSTIIHSLQGGGAERVMAMLVSRLAERGHNVSLVTLDDACDDRHDVDARVRRIPLNVMRPSQNVRDRVLNVVVRLRAIRRALLASDPDVVLSFCDQTNIQTLAAMTRTSVPIVIAERSDPEQQRLSGGWERARRHTYARAAQTIALTESSAAFLRPICRNGVVVIPSAIEVPPVTSDRQAASERQCVIGIGRLAPEKGFDRLIEAFAMATETMPQWRLQLLGDGAERASLERLATELGIASRVTFSGWVRPIWQPLAEATLFVLPSRYEGFPSALLEAMAVGVPSIAADCPSGPREIITHDVDGLLVQSSTQALAKAMQTLMSDVVHRERLGNAGRAVVERFGCDAMVDAYERELQRVCRKRR